LFLDTRDLSWRQVPIPRSIELVVADSGISHRHAGGEYNRRREECERAAAQLGVSLLRDVGPEDFARITRLPEPLDRRARHVVTENARVLAAVEALENDHPEPLGALIDESHRSLRDDYEASIEPIERLVSGLRKQDGVLGARLTGGGFGGSVMALARRGSAESAGVRAVEAYRRATDSGGKLLVPSIRSPQHFESA
jgi:galactokinase